MAGHASVRPANHVSPEWHRRFDARVVGGQPGRPPPVCCDQAQERQDQASTPRTICPAGGVQARRCGRTCIRGYGSDHGTSGEPSGRGGHLAAVWLAHAGVPTRMVAHAPAARVSGDRSPRLRSSRLRSCSHAGRDLEWSRQSPAGNEGKDFFVYSNLPHAVERRNGSAPKRDQHLEHL
jgi:hypothetical protein